jgi:penicillin amidase
MEETMLSKIARILLGVLVVLLVIVLALAIYGLVTVRRSFPQTQAELHLAGLDGPVDIYRDSFGIPHIYASTEHDLFFAEGFVHAQDRFWQMDFWRHIGSGRLSEMFGESQLDTDRFLRTLGWARVVEKELAALDPQSMAILDAYAQGVNAYLQGHQGSALSLEYAILKLLNASYQPEPWQSLHTLTWAKAMAWDLGGNMDGEIERSILLKTLSEEQLADIIPPYPSDHPYILPDFRLKSQSLTGPGTSLAMNPDAGSEIAAALEAAARQLSTLDDVLGPRGLGIGSNNWVISGQRTSTGQPLLANDPHLGIQMPSIWYEIGLHCQPKGVDCRFDVAGFSFAGAPGVVIGHNNRIAWGFTNVGPDVQDLYLESINPDNPNQYMVNGAWADMELVQERIQVAGGQPVDLTVRYTRHGPIISETYGKLKDFGESAGIDVPKTYAVALRWTALEPSYTFPALWKMNLAQNWEEFRAAAAQFDVPSQNLVYADVDGNIGYQTPGKIPVRTGGDGRWPAQGWTDDYEWEGYIPFEDLPYTFNPPEGYIVTANNAVVGEEYPYLISLDWDWGYRARRIVDMIEGAPGPIDIPYIQTMQGDNKDLSTEFTLPVLLNLPIEDGRLQGARALLEGWDGQAHMDSAPAALYAAFWRALLAGAFQDDLPQDYWPAGGSRWFEVVRLLVEKPDSPWWDDQKTPQVENRDAIFLQAFRSAVSEMEGLQGKNPKSWSWGDMHGAVFANQSLGKSGVAPIEALFNRGPFRASGGEAIVNATGWSAVTPYGVDWIPSMRMIVDLSNLQNSLTIHTTGESGHAFHRHYIDMADLWRMIQYHPMLWERGQVEAGAEGRLRLLP